MKVYVVFEGHNPGVYESWAKCHEQISSFKYNLHQSYPTREAREQALFAYQKKKKLEEAKKSKMDKMEKNLHIFHAEQPQRQGLELSVKDLVIGVLIVVVLVQCYLLCTK
jgi:viroplasmin and RNaseH domain-containing protein